MDRPHTFVSSDNFVAAFNEFHTGQKLNQEFFQPFTKAEDHKNALSSNIYSLGEWELFEVCLARKWLLMKRNSTFYVLSSAQVTIN